MTPAVKAAKAAREFPSKPWCTSLLDQRALGFSKIYISAGKRGLELALDPRHLLEVCGGEVTDLCRSRA